MFVETLLIHGTLSGLDQDHLRPRPGQGYVQLPCHITLPLMRLAETLSELGAFRARHAAAAAKNASLKATVPEIDLARYKSILKDQRAVEQAQKVLSEFKPVTYDVAKFTSAIDAFEGRAVSRLTFCEVQALKRLL